MGFRKIVSLLSGIIGLAVLSIGTSPSANAAVVTRLVNVTLDALNFESFDLDVDLDGTTDFTFEDVYAVDPDPTQSVGSVTIDFRFGSNNAVVVDSPATDGFPTTSLLSVGDFVSDSNLFSNINDNANLYFLIPGDPPSGNFLGQTGFVGLRFDTPNGIAYGFAQISVNDINAPVNPLGLTIGLVGYNDTVGQAAQITAVPEPTSTLLLAVGSGCLFYRRVKRRLFRRTANRF